MVKVSPFRLFEVARLQNISFPIHCRVVRSNRDGEPYTAIIGMYGARAKLRGSAEFDSVSDPVCFSFPPKTARTSLSICRTLTMGNSIIIKSNSW